MQLNNSCDLIEVRNVLRICFSVGLNRATFAQIWYVALEWRKHVWQPILAQACWKVKPAAACSHTLELRLDDTQTNCLNNILHAVAAA
eukprot:963036-Amphidinium_carterae.1